MACAVGSCCSTTFAICRRSLARHGYLFIPWDSVGLKLRYMSFHGLTAPITLAIRSPPPNFSKISCPAPPMGCMIIVC